ncbi:MAG: hypothetical protein ACK4NA_12715 [Alphaproteobacteria bacterium]
MKRRRLARAARQVLFWIVVILAVPIVWTAGRLAAVAVWLSRGLNGPRNAFTGAPLGEDRYGDRGGMPPLVLRGGDWPRDDEAGA